MAAWRIFARDDDGGGSTGARLGTQACLATPTPGVLPCVSHHRSHDAGLPRRIRLLALLLLAGAAAAATARSPEGSYGSPPAAVPGTPSGYGVPRPVPEPDRYFVPPSPQLPQYDRQPQLQTRPGDAFADPPRAYPTPPRHYPTPPRAWPQNNHRNSRP